MLVDRLNDVLRVEPPLRIHDNGSLRAQGLQPGYPLLRAVTGRHGDLGKFFDRLLRVRNDRNVHHDVARNGRRVDIDMYDLRVFGKFADLARDTVVKARSDGKEKVAFGHRRIGRHVAVHPHVSDIQRVIGRQRPLAHDGGDDGNAHLFGKLRHRLATAGNIHAAADEKERTLCGGKHFRRLFQLPHMHARRGLVTADGDFLGVLVAAQRQLNVLGEIDEDRSRLARTGNIEGFLDDPAQILAPAHGDGVLADRTADPDDVHFLERVVADEIGRHLARKADERDAVVIGGCDARDEICSSRAAGDQADARLTRGARIPVRRVDERLLVAGKDDAECRFTVQRVKQIDRHAARIGEQGVHTLLYQRLDKKLRSFDFHFTDLRSVRPAAEIKNAPNGRKAVRGDRIDRVTTRIRERSRTHSDADVPQPLLR